MRMAAFIQVLEHPQGPWVLGLQKDGIAQLTSPAYKFQAEGEVMDS